MEGIDLEQEQREIINAYRGLLRASKDLRDKEDTKLIKKAFNVALDAHSGDRRKSGEPYIYHPIAVARICAEEMDLGTTSIVAALLHDTVEDTHLTLDDIEEMFGSKIRMIIDGLTKIPEVFDENVSLQAENFRKMILTISDDLRVILIKIADRLHNMRTLESMRKDKQLKIASETQYIYAPLSHRLGLNSIKTELENLSFKYKLPEVYEEIENKLEKTKDVRTRFIRSFTNPIKRVLDHEGYVYQIKARTKSVYSIWRKMYQKNIPFEEIYDIFAIRIIVDTPIELEKPDCWRIYSLVTDFYQPNPDRLRDWISTPKANGYESLHTTVMSPTGKWVEVQIRTKRMDEVAEKGYAAHYKYKDNSIEPSKFDRWLGEIKDLLENPESNAIDFIDDFKLNLFSDEIYIFTPKGDLKVLPKGSCTLDFAFDIHTDVGCKCIGAKVNNKLVPLSHELNSGDQVEIITSSKQTPKSDWLKFVSTARAKAKIKSALKEERRKITTDGKEVLYRKLNGAKIPTNDENLNALVKLFNVSDIAELFYQSAKGKINFKSLKDFKLINGVIQVPSDIDTKQDDLSKELLNAVDIKKDTIVIGESFKDLPYKLSKCCNPIPGDEVFGFISAHEGIKIHRTECPNATQLMSKYAYRVIKARWESQKLEERMVQLRLIGVDDIGIVNKITEIISNQHSVNMKSIFFNSEDGMFEGNITLYVYDNKHLEAIIDEFTRIEGVKTVERRFDESAETEE
ncbi:MAG: bifunctional (p)ppGpp synthetase/guanosine-3',5'-bis(diphosphate) 3'-pyrophosphohydrolase [Crocinitomicaceae bacterium]|nr:bifunctional (p)ppGpp synthetase/guanosine-3',5'-bis(diphosphate) 3'-pyrophosphohydrolase [Crocinitomicaceae bacterium]